MIADIVGRRQLVLDFDGVLCDSFEECVQVSWCAHLGAPVQAFTDEVVPEEVVARFKRLRPYMRNLPHFIVGLLDEPEPIGREAFVARFDELPAGLADAFDAAAREYRAAVREAARASWLARHVIEPRVAALVDGAYIATARDTASVVELLEAHGAKPDADRIYELLVTKPAALAAIAEREGLAADGVFLLDDSIDNCLAAKAAGFAAGWAEWGYNAPGDDAIATDAGIPVIRLEDVARAA